MAYALESLVQILEGDQHKHHLSPATRSYSNLGNYNCAISAFKKGLEIDPTNDELKHRLFSEKVREAFSNGNFLDAIQHCTDAIKLRHSDYIRYHYRSVTHTPLKQPHEALCDAQKTVQLKPDWSEGYTHLGDAYLHLCNYNCAISAFEKGLEIDPTNDLLKHRLFSEKVREAFSNGNFLDAIQHCTDAIKLRPSDYIRYHYRSVAHTHLKQPHEALCDAQKIVQLKPDWSEGYTYLGNAYSNLGNYNRAIFAFENGLEIDPTNDELKHRLFSENGRAAFSNGNFLDAIQHCTDAIKLRHSDYTADHNRSVAHTRLKQPHEALCDAQKTVQLKPDWSEGYTCLRNAYSNLGNYKCAISAFEKGLEIDPTNDELKHRLFSEKGREAFSNGNFVDAIQHCTDAIKLRPSDFILYHNRSAAHTCLKQPHEALCDAQKTVQLKPDWSIGYICLGNAYFDLKNYEDALSAYKKGLEIDLTNDRLKRRLFNVKGMLAFSIGNFDDAIQHYTDAINLYPSNDIYYSNRSEAHASLNQFSRAMSDAQEAVRLNPDWDEGYSRLGDVYLGLQIYEDAVSAYEKALKIRPSNAKLKSALSS